MRRRISNVEWIDERLIGHTSAYREGGMAFVEVRVSGTVLLNGVEHILDHVVTVPVEKSTIAKEGGTHG